MKLMNNRLRFPAIWNLAGIVIVVTGLIYARSVINPLLMALFISIIFTQPIAWLKRKKVPQGMALAIMICVLLLVYFGFFELIVSSLSMFIEEAPIYQESLKELFTSTHHSFLQKGVSLSFLQGSHVAHPESLMKVASEVLLGLKDFISGEITFIFLVIFLLVEIEAIYFKTKLIEKNSPFPHSVFEKINNSIQHYLTIKSLTSLATGLLVGIALFFIGVDHPVLWGVIAFLLNFIPTIGSIIAAIPAILVSIVQLGFPATYWTIGTYILANVFIGSVLEPRIMGKGMGLSVTVVFLSLLIWGLILGPVGMFLSVPITILLKIVLENFPKTRWIAALLGTKNETLLALEK